MLVAWFTFLTIAGLVWFLLYAHKHRSILGSAGHITLTPANQLLVMDKVVWLLTNLGFKPATFQSLAIQANHCAG
jgi:hypothetical protein